MEKRFKEKQVMCMAVVEYIGSVSEDVLGLMPQFDVAIGRLKVLLKELRNANEVQQVDRKGFSELKLQQRVSMVTAAIDVSSRIEAYAVNNKDVKLEHEIKFRYSELFKKRDTVCADLCGFIHKKGSLLLGDLASYGVTALVLADLDAKVKLFVKSIPKPRRGILDKKAATRKIIETIEGIDEVLGTMDTLVRMLRFSNPEFYRLYFSSRKLIKRGHRVLALEGFVVDEAGEPVRNVAVSVLGTRVRRRSSALGSFWVKNLKKGVYILTFERVGYETERASVSIVSGLRSEVRVVMRQREVLFGG